MALTDGKKVDKKLTDIYADKVTVNLNRANPIPPEEVWQTMQIIAINNKALVKINFL